MLPHHFSQAQGMEEKMMGQDDLPEFPPDLTTEQREVYLQTYIMSTLGRNGFKEAIADFFARNPELSLKFRDEHRQHTVHKLGNLLAGTKLTSLPLEMLTSLIDMSDNDVASLTGAIQLAKSHHITFNEQDVKEAIDISHVVEVMEPDPEPDVGQMKEDEHIPTWRRDVGPIDMQYLKSLAEVRSPEWAKERREFAELISNSVIHQEPVSLHEGDRDGSLDEDP